MPQISIDERKILWIWLKNIFKYSDTKALGLIKIFDSPENLYMAKRSDFKEVKGISLKEIDMLCDKNLGEAEKIYKNALKSDTRVIIAQEQSYPELLKHIYEPPPVLYVKGDIDCLKDRLVIAGDGTRKCDEQAKSTMKQIAYELAESGVCVVSGMASGIDSAAHSGALAANGKTAAVLGTAIDRIYPSENRELYYKIIQSGGAVISEHPPGYYGFKSDFVRRNRIIAGLSHGVVVCQAPQRSGSLTTARAALDFGRDTFCVPGNANELNEGGNRLIMEGCARMVLSAEDIIDEYINEGAYERFSLKKPVSNKEPAKEDKEESVLPKLADKIKSFEKNKEEGKYDDLDENQRKVVMYIKDQRILSENLCQALNMEAAVLSAVITELEIEDVLTNDNGYIFLNI